MSNHFRKVLNFFKLTGKKRKTNKTHLNSSISSFGKPWLALSLFILPDSLQCLPLLLYSTYPILLNVTVDMTGFPGEPRAARR